MKHKFNIFLLLSGLASLAMVGCTKVEQVPAVEQSIAFAVGTYAQQTKVGKLDEIDNITSFTSKAFLHANGAAAGTDYFGQNGVTIQKNGDLWEPARPYYWPLSGDSYINFVSWYDNGGTPTTATETTLAWTGRTIAASDNILYADEAWNFHGNVERFYTSGVPTLFHHALARVAFDAKAEPLTDPDHAGTTWTVTVHSAIVSAIHRAGSMTLTNSDPATQATTKAWNHAQSLLWTPTDAAQNFTLKDSNTILSDTEQDLLAMQSILPQSLGNDVLLTISYTVTTITGNNEVASETATRTIQLNQLLNASSIPISEWAPNKKYTYHITINPMVSRIYLNPTVSDWTTAGAFATVE